MHVLALDVGAESVRAAVVESDSDRMAGPVCDQACQVRRPGVDAAEVTATDLWPAIVSAARHACRDFPNVLGIGLSVRTPTLVLLDKTDKPIGSIWTAEDRRARPAARQVWAGVGDEFLATTGNRSLPGLTSAVQYRQRLSDDPYLSHNVRSFLHLNGWLALRMTGERAFDSGNASMSGLFGTLTDRSWSSRWCEYFEVDKEWLPPVLDGNTTIGTIRAAAAAELGVTAGIPVKLGLLDPAGAILGAKITADDLLHEVDSVQTLTALVPSQPRAADNVTTRLLGLGDAYVQTAHNPVGSAAVSWFRELCFQDQDAATFFNKTLPAALGRSPRVVLDPPFLAGDPLSIEAHRGAFRDLTLGDERVDLLAALVQAMRRGHEKALAALGSGRTWKRVLMGGEGLALVNRLLWSNIARRMEPQEQWNLHGVANLFRPK